MAGIGIGLGVGLGGGGGGWSEAGIARVIAGKGLTDATARSAIGGAASLAAGLRAVGLLPTAAAAPPPAVTPLPSGIAAMWDAASLSALADGAAVTSWTDGVGGSVATPTSDSGTPHSYIANSGGLPAVRLSGAAVLATSGANAANTAMTSAERAIVVVARNIQTPGPGQERPCLAASGTGNTIMLQASPTQTGRYSAMYDCADAGMRTLGYAGSSSLNLGMDDVNGTAIVVPNNVGGQITIGGWQNVGGSSCGRADVLAVIVFNRMLTSADFKQIHRRYCELLGQTRPGGGTARTVTCIGDSLTAGAYVSAPASWPFTMAAGLGLPWGTWDQLGTSGYTWPAIQSGAVPLLGSISGATGTRNIVCAFEFANMRGIDSATIVANAQSVVNALHAQDGNREIVLGTSTDDGSSPGVASRPNRTAYDAAVTGVSGVAAFVSLHLDPHIGVIGAAPTDGGGNAYYQADGVHNTAAGYGLIDNGPYGFRSTVQARLTA